MLDLAHGIPSICVACLVLLCVHYTFSMQSQLPSGCKSRSLAISLQLMQPSHPERGNLEQHGLQLFSLQHTQANIASLCQGQCSRPPPRLHNNA